MEKLILGAVCYAPKVVEIWEGFKTFFNDNNLPFDFILYSNYETQVEALFKGEIDLAWNSPLAWIRAKRIADSKNIEIQAISMRDSDCDLSSIFVVKSDSQIKTLEDLKDKTISFGAIDSPQATLIPLQVLKDEGLVKGKDFKKIIHNLLAGKHGDHVGGEEEAIKDVINNRSDAACIIEGNLNSFISSGIISNDSVKILHKTPTYDHCNFTVLSNSKAELKKRFNEILLEMSYEDPKMRHLLDLEGLKQWKLGRTSEYEILE